MGQDAGSGCLGRGKSTAYAAYDAEGGRTAQQLAETATGVDEHPYQRHEQQGVAGIGDGNAPRVGVQGQHRALHVLVEAALVEPYAVVRGDAVHRHGERRGLLVLLADDDVRHVVGGSLGALVILHLEPLQGDGEGQGLAVHVLVDVLADGYAGAQVDGAPTGRQMGKQCAGQDDDERQVEHYHEGLSDALLNEIEHCHGRQ